MTTIPSVNPEAPADIPESEGATEQWIDPIFSEAELSDEPQPEPKEDGPTPEQIAALKEQTKPAEEPDAKADDDDGEDDEDDPKDEKDEKAEDAKDGEKPRRRRSKARRERRALERQVRELQERLEALAKPPVENAAQEAEQAEEAVPRPKLEDFDYDNERWADALSEWMEQRLIAPQKQAEEAKQKEAAEQARREALETFHDREEDARDKYDDYDDVVYDKTRFIPQAAADLIFESENGPELAYYLATHQDEAKKMKDLSDAQVARAIGRIEARIEAAQADKKEDPDADPDDSAAEAKAAERAEPTTDSPPQPRRPSTKAPAPVPTVSGGAASTRDPSKMSNDEYREARMAGRIR